MSLDTVANKAFAVRRRQVSPTAAGRWLSSFFFIAVSEALAIQETMGPTMWPSVASSARKGRRLAPERRGRGEGGRSCREELHPSHILCPRLWVAVWPSFLGSLRVFVRAKGCHCTHNPSRLLEERLLFCLLPRYRRTRFGRHRRSVQPGCRCWALLSWRHDEPTLRDGLRNVSPERDLRGENFNKVWCFWGRSMNLETGFLKAG